MNKKIHFIFYFDSNMILLHCRHDKSKYYKHFLISFFNSLNTMLHIVCSQFLCSYSRKKVIFITFENITMSPCKFRTLREKL